MIDHIVHIGVTITDMDRSIKFYRDTLGLRFEGELIMQGKETDELFQRENTKVRVAYYNSSKELIGPPIELLQFIGSDVKQEKCDLFKTSISEICFLVKDIDKTYDRLVKQGVEFLSEPQFFDFTKDGFSKSKAVYLKDPDGIILELMQYL